jgi:hypothetical protein
LLSSSSCANRNILNRDGVQGVIDWHPILRETLARATWMFNMPIGNSSAAPRSTTAPQPPYLHVAAGAVRSGSTAPCHLAKLLVYTLRADLAAQAAPGGGVAPLQALDQLTALFEHFFHASNHGRYARRPIDTLQAQEEACVHACATRSVVRKAHSANARLQGLHAISHHSCACARACARTWQMMHACFR